MKRIFTLLSFFILSSNVIHAQVNHEMIAVVEQSAGTFSLYDPQTNKKYGNVKVGDLPHEVIISSDKKTAYVSNFGIQDYDETIGEPGLSISVIDMKNFTEKNRLYFFDENNSNSLTQLDRAPHGIRLRPPFEKELFVNLEKGNKMYVFDVNTQKVIRKFPLVSSAHNFIFSPDGKIVWIIAGKEGIIKMDPDTGKETGQFKLASPIRGLVYTPDNKYLIASGANEVVLFDPITLKEHKRYDQLGVGQIIYSDITPDGRLIVSPAVWDGQVVIIDTKSGKVIKKIVTGIDPVTVKISKDGKFAYVTNARDTHVTEVNLDTFAFRYIPAGEGPNGLAMTDFMVPNNHKELNIGVPLPLTGKESAQGRDIMLGYELWRLSVRQRGGLLIGDQAYDINFIYLDTKSSSQQIEKLTKELILNNKVNIMFPTYGQNENNIEKQTAKKYKIPYFSETKKDLLNTKTVLADHFLTKEKFVEQYRAYYNLDATELSRASTYEGIYFEKMLAQILPTSKKSTLKQTLSTFVQ